MDDVYKVNVCDPDTNHTFDRSNEMVQWAQTHCKSFVGVEELDVSDFSMYHDTIHIFSFKDKKDSMWFNLKWQ